MKLRDLIFGREERDDEPPDFTEKDQELEELAVNHEATLRAVHAVLSESQGRVAVAIDETGDAIRKLNSTRRRRR